MTERPIIFSTPMILAILDGKKTMTRRVIKPQPAGHEFNGFNAFGEAIFYPRDDNSDDAGLRRCPFGQPGDKLWVRETWRTLTEGIEYRADWVDPPRGIWKSPIFMPRLASRITLEIAAIRVERIQDITEEDIRYAEGCLYTPWLPSGDPLVFQNVWDSLNAKRGYGWEKNPFVWVIEFRRLP